MIHFNMCMGYGLGRCWLIARLQNSQDGGMTVAGTAGADPSVIIIFGLLLVFPLGGLLVNQSLVAFLMGLILAVGIAIGFHFSLRNMRNNLISALEEILPS